MADLLFIYLFLLFKHRVEHVRCVLHVYLLDYHIAFDYVVKLMKNMLKKQNTYDTRLPGTHERRACAVGHGERGRLVHPPHGKRRGTVVCVCVCLSVCCTTPFKNNDTR